jgi:probable phosphoglycerate mutase
LQITRILAIRHGETAWNKDTRIQGHLDIALNPTGRWQAERTAAALRHEALDAVYSSDLARARETAQAIAQAQQRPLATHPGLRERCFGEFQGRTWDELETHFPESALAWRKRVPDFAPAGGESLLQLRERVVNTFAELAERHLGQQIAIVAHGGVLDVLYRAATQIDLQAPRSWKLGNAAINRVLWSPEGFSLVGWGDDAHLNDESLEETTT